MKKIIIAVVVVAVLAVAGFLLMGKLDSFIAETIETEGTKALGVPVKVAGVTLDIKQGLAGISGLTIANPEGYSKPYAIQLNEFSAEVDYSTREIAAIIIDKPVITAEMKGANSNFKDLADNMPASETEEAPEATEEEESGDAPEISIKLIKLSEATVQVISDQLGEEEFVMDTLIIRDLKGTPDVIAKAIAARLTSHVTGQIANHLVKSQVQNKVNDAINEKLGEKFGDKLGDIKLKF